MPTNKKTIAIYADDTLRKKIEFLSDKERRSISNYIQYILKEKIEEYETENGVIQ